VNVIYLDAADHLTPREWHVPADLTDATAIALRIEGDGDLACDWVYDATGTVRRRFSEGDVAIGVWRCRTRVSWRDGTIATFPTPGADRIHVQA
jgi:hypothetical protein